MYARENGCPWNFCTVNWAVREGNFTVLTYAIENGCFYHDSVIFHAIETYHYYFIMYIHEKTGFCECRITNFHICICDEIGKSECLDALRLYLLNCM